MSLIDGLVFPICLAASIVLFTQMAHLEPYMDEIFHIPQTKVICAGDFTSWDAKITTLPGLYYLVCGNFSLARLAIDIDASPFIFRTINFLLSCFVAAFAQQYYNTLQAIHNPSSSSKQSSLIPALVFMYPFSAFYYNLFYTDTVSTASTLGMLCLSTKLLQQTQRTPAFYEQILLLLVSCFAILTRQTNVLWVLFALGTTFLFHFHSFTSDTNQKTNDILSFIAFLWQRKGFLLIRGWSLSLAVGCFVVFVVINGGIVVGDKENHVPTVHWAMLSHLCAINGALLLPELLCQKLLLNRTSNSHRNADHQPTAQGLTWDSAVIAKKNTLPMATIREWTLPLALGLFVGAGLVYGSRSHPFLLADNRHYTFYLWQRILSKTRYRKLLGASYVFLSALFFHHHLQGSSDTDVANTDARSTPDTANQHGQHGHSSTSSQSSQENRDMDCTTSRRVSSSTSGLWLFIYLIASALSLLPTPLLEVRYFTLPALVALLHRDCFAHEASAGLASHHLPQKTVLLRYAREGGRLLTLTIFMLMNILTVYVYVHRPFYQPTSSTQVARFMY